MRLFASDQSIRLLILRLFGAVRAASRLYSVCFLLLTGKAAKGRTMRFALLHIQTHTKSHKIKSESLPLASFRISFHLPCATNVLQANIKMKERRRRRIPLQSKFLRRHQYLDAIEPFSPEAVLEGQRSVLQLRNLKNRKAAYRKIESSAWSCLQPKLLRLLVCINLSPPG